MQNKISYIKNFPETLRVLEPDEMGKWGKMNAQHMVEHMSEAFRLASGKHESKPVLTPEQTQKSYAFMMSEFPFKENTPNKLLPDNPVPYRNTSMKDAIAELQKEIDHFFSVYAGNSELRKVNPFFGNLNFEEQVQLLHKHATHHARQFGLVG